MRKLASWDNEGINLALYIIRRVRYFFKGLQDFETHGQQRFVRVVDGLARLATAFKNHLSSEPKTETHPAKHSLGSLVVLVLSHAHQGQTLKYQCRRTRRDYRRQNPTNIF